MATKSNYKKEEKLKFVEVLAAKNGHVTNACKAFGISRVTYMNWLKKHKWFNQAIQDYRESEIDDAEDMLRLHRKGVPEYFKDSKGNLVLDKKGNPIIKDWLIKPDPKSTQFFLERKAKDRGYGKSEEITVVDAPKMPDVVIGLTVVKPK